MMQIAICEDEPLERERLVTTIQQVLIERKQRAEIQTFSRGEQLLEWLSKREIESPLFFLDVYMPGENGVQIGEKIRTRLPDAEIIFVTSSKEHAVDAFSLRALHYLLKPVTKAQVQEAFHRLEENREKVQQITLKMGRDTIQVDSTAICYVQSENKRTAVYIQGQTEPCLTSYSLSEMEKQLPPSLFLKIQRGIIVSMHYISKMTTDSCQLKNGETLLLSRKERGAIRSRYKEFVFNQVERG